MQINTYKCPSCNAPVGKDDLSCEFCGAEITKMHNGKILVPVKDFGAKGIGYLSLILFVAIAIYIAGWFFEDTEYWLNTNAVLLWTVALPFWILITTITWSCKWGAVLYGIIVSVAVFISHIIIMGYFENWNMVFILRYPYFHIVFGIENSTRFNNRIKF